MKVLLFALLAVVSASAYRGFGPPLRNAEVSEDHTEAWRAHLLHRRTQQIERLRTYAEAGVFPINDAQPGLQNIFMDEQGRRCAMADLIWRDGAQDLVRKTARSHNDVQLATVREGPLMDWIVLSGLTLEEVGLIQEPDFFISDDLPEPTREELIAAEQERLRWHFIAAADRLEVYTDANIALSLSRLGSRLASPPPAIIETTASK